ncbi:TIGR04255 family protein [Microbacterium sp. NPDC086615]|uniref:TIGR04255 family protein n=1 Tax=Microbacterium sp. NPDC086615 TaxID=3154865 RepID=UPI00342679C4
MTTDWYDPSNLPAFDSPPVTETAMAFEFPTLAGMDVIKLVQLQSAWGADYPELSEVPGALPTQAAGGDDVFVAFGNEPRRIWAAHPSNGLLLQTQADRLVLNWRKRFTSASYPGYTELRNEFLLRWSQMLDSLSALDLPLPQPHLVEFTYVNNVPLAEGELLSDVLAIISNASRLPGDETFGTFQFVREVQPGDHPFPAQINIQGQPVQAPEGPLLAFRVTARVLVDGDYDAAYLGLDAAHALASHSFAGLVTQKKQEIWGRTR